MRRFVLVLLGVLALGSFSGAAEAQKKDVDIKAPDGINLKGTYFSTTDKKEPGVLLLHQCDMDRHAWDGFATDLASAGFHVLTFDFRGYGDSEGKVTTPLERQNLLQKWEGDIDAAFSYLLSQKGVDKSHIAAGGASCGVSAASDFVIRHRQVKALIELSGITPDERFISQTPDLAIFGAAMEGDTTNPRSPQGIKDLLASSKNPRSELHIYPGTAHGARMFAQNHDLEPLIIAWLKTQEMGRSKK